MSQDVLREASELATENTVAVLAGAGLPASFLEAVDRFIDAYGRVGAYEHYRHVPAAAVDLCEAAIAGKGPEARRLFLRVALGRAVGRLVESGRLASLPPRILGHQSRQLRRIAATTAEDADWYDLGHDIFLKDMGLATLRLMAAAAQLLDTRCGIPRSIALRQGLFAAPGLLARFARLGGFKPFVQIHTHLSYLDQFDEEGWNECYRCCADLYAARPELLGMYGASWFYDPALAAISPRLAYLSDVPLSGGADRWFVEKGGESIANATSTSPSRRKLYEEGRYMPASYMIVWGRQRQIAWAGAHP